VRVHSGTLSEADVVSNYQLENGLFQRGWAGAAGTPLPWTDPNNWLNGNVGQDGDTVWINNGGIAVLSHDLTLNHLFPAAGGLTISGGAKLTLGALASVELADNAAFALTVANGHLRVPGSGAINLNMGVRGGDATATVGGSGDPAVIDVDRDLIVAASAGSVGSLTVGDGGGAFVSNGWFYAASSLGAQATVTVNGGELGCRLPGKNLVVNANGARGEITVNDGLVNATADFVWSAGTSTNVAYGAVMLNGGTLRAQRLYASTTAGTNLLFLNGGTVEAVNSRTDFMYNLTAARVQAGGTVTAVSTYSGAGIGGGMNGAGGTVNISGGTVTATGRNGGAGIGGGTGSAGGATAISGGTVTAAGSYSAADIGPGDGSTDAGANTFTGGSILLVNDSIALAPSNATARVWCVTVTNLVPHAAVTVTSLGTYGVNDLFADENGRLYLWLPDNVYSFTAGGSGYTAAVNGADATATLYLAAPVFAADGSGIVVSGTTLAITIANAQSGVYYTLYGAPEPGGPWTLEQSVPATADGLLTFTLSNMTAPKRFFKVEASTDPP